MASDLRVPVLEAVPNISEGRDLGLIREMVDRISVYDVEVLDWSTDPDHHRAVITFIGSPPAVEDAAISLAGLLGSTLTYENIGECIRGSVPWMCCRSFH